MKEFLAQTGGRYTYADDFLNLQDLALSASSIYEDCGDLIISGCRLVEGRLTAGCVYLNGKIRRVPETLISGDRVYIYESNSYENIEYATGGSKVGRAMYGVRIENTELVDVVDPVTGAAPKYITASANNDYTMAVKFFSRYCLSTSPYAGAQTVPNPVTFQTQIAFADDVLVSSSLSFGNTLGQNVLNYNGGSVVLRIMNGNLKFSFGGDNLFKIEKGGDTVFYLTEDNWVTAGRVTSRSLSTGSLTIDQGHIYQGVTDGVATLNINLKSFGGGNTQFRDTVIGNGKGKQLANFKGSGNRIDLFVPTNIYGVLNIYDVVEGANLNVAMCFRTANGSLTSIVGYSGNPDNIFHIRALNTPVQITGTYLNVVGSIRENGVNLSDKYALKSEFATATTTYAARENVYDKADSDGRYGLKTGGLSQFITPSVTAEDLRDEIGAVSNTDLQQYVRKSDMLSDIAQTEEEKAQIRANIGACSIDEVQPRLGDTGWVDGTSAFPGFVKARQIGNIVYVVGQFSASAGTSVGINDALFNIPNAVQAPVFDIQTRIMSGSNMIDASVIITAGTRMAKSVDNLAIVGNTLKRFSFTYFV